MKKRTVLVACLAIVAAGALLVLLVVGPRRAEEPSPVARTSDALPPTRLVKPEEAQIPPEWDADISALVADLNMSPERALWTAVSSGEVTRKDDIDSLRDGFDSLPVAGDALAGPEAVKALRDMARDFSLAFMLPTEKCFSEYAKLMTSTGHRFVEKVRYARSVPGLPHDAAAVEGISDERVYTEFCRNGGDDCAWEGIVFASSKAVIYSADSVPEERVGAWAGALSKNIRTYNPCFKPEKRVADVIAEDKHVLFADVTLSVARSAAWDNRITQYHIRLWLDESSGKWQLHDASMVKESPTYGDATFQSF